MPNCPSVTLPSSTTSILLKCLGLLGSDHAGERAAAGLKADQILRANDLTWSDLIRAPQQHQQQHQVRNWREARDYCAAHFYALRERERNFIDDLASWRGAPTEKQSAWLAAIYTRLREAS